jgi:hypothetical protein
MVMVMMMVTADGDGTVAFTTTENSTCLGDGDIYYIRGGVSRIDSDVGLSCRRPGLEGGM